MLKAGGKGSEKEEEEKSRMEEMEGEMADVHKY